MTVDAMLKGEFSTLSEDLQDTVQTALRCAGSGDLDSAEHLLWSLAEEADAWCAKRNESGDSTVFPVWRFLLPDLLGHWDRDFECDDTPEEEGECPDCQAKYDSQQRAISWLLLQMALQFDRSVREMDDRVAKEVVRMRRVLRQVARTARRAKVEIALLWLPKRLGFEWARQAVGCRRGILAECEYTTEEYRMNLSLLTQRYTGEMNAR